MKKIILLVVMPTIIGFLASFRSAQPTENIPKEVQTELKKMRFIEGGTFIMGRGQSQLTAPESDSILLLGDEERRVTCSSFWMSETEVTNKEWAAFYQAIRAELGADSAAQYLPDTMVWLQSGTYNEPFVRYYFQHPAYANYPVVGVSWHQIQAYCKWRTDYVNTLLEKSGSKLLIPRFRLPTEAEWEYAAQGLTELSGLAYNDENLPYRVFPWDGTSLWDSKGQSRANWSISKDEYGFLFRNSAADNAAVTAPVDSYLPNGWGLYNMAGNVAEWVLDVARVQTSTSFDDLDVNAVSATDILRTLDEGKIRAWVSTRLKNPTTQEIDKQTKLHMRNAQILFGSDVQKRVVKGGSWAAPAAYLMCSSRVAFDEHKTSATIGFRLAMTCIGGYNHSQKPPKTPLYSNTNN